MRESQDGFVIAEQDLLIRGPGDVLGVRQSGERQMRIADIMRDQALLSFVQNITEELIAQHANVLPQLMQRWLGSEIKYLQA
jgi:ATP-dependent DNA helicase RecG